MDAAMERRAEKRVCPPGDAVLDFALWPAAVATPPRLPISELGPPLASAATGQDCLLVDVTGQGLGLFVRAVPAVRQRLAAAPALFVYLKLRDYRVGVPDAILSLFCQALPAHVDLLPDGLALGLRLVRQGRGSAHDKALEILDVHRFGVPELTAWTDAVARCRQGQPQQVLAGLDLDRLLDEPPCRPGRTGDKGNQP